MRQATPVLLGLLLLSTAAGCLGDPREDQGETRSLNQTLQEMTDNTSHASSPPNGSEATGTTGTSVGTSTIHRLAFEGTAVSERFWRNGSFSGSDACPPTSGNCPALRYDRVPLSEHAPVGMPVRVEATLTYETAWDQAVRVSSIGLDLNASGEVYDVTSTDTPGHANLEGVAVADPSSEVFLDVVYSGQEPAHNVSYSLEVSIEGAPSRVPTNVPVRVQLPAESSILTVSPREDKTVRAWLADGGYVGDFALEEGEVKLPLDGGRSYVILVAAQTRFVSLFSADAPTAPPPLVPLEESRTFGTPHRLGPQGSTRWSFEVDDVPLRVGVYLDPAGPSARSGLEGNVSHEGQSIFSFRTGRTTVTTTGARSTWASSSGLTNVTAGTWDGQVRAGVSTPVEVGEVLVRFGDPVLQR